MYACGPPCYRGHTTTHAANNQPPLERGAMRRPWWWEARRQQQGQVLSFTPPPPPPLTTPRRQGRREKPCYCYAANKSRMQVLRNYVGLARKTRTANGPTPTNARTAALPPLSLRVCHRESSWPHLPWWNEWHLSGTRAYQLTTPRGAHSAKPRRRAGKDAGREATHAWQLDLIGVAASPYGPNIQSRAAKRTPRIYL
jgi:hypothetical protein